MSYAECETLDTMRNLEKKVYTCLYFLSDIKIYTNQLLGENITLLGNLRSILMSYAECEQLDTMRNSQKKSIPVYTF